MVRGRFLCVIILFGYSYLCGSFFSLSPNTLQAQGESIRKTQKKKPQKKVAQRKGAPRTKRRPYPKTTYLVPTRDGRKLATDVFLPSDLRTVAPQLSAPAGPWPVVFLRGPYGKNGYGVLLAGAICSRGYAFVTQDMRGRFESPGTDAVVFANDGVGKNRDGHDALKWISQQSWCNGKIATWGGSALGITQTLMAPQAPEALSAQFIRWGTSNFYMDAAHQGGAFRKVLVEGWLKSIKAEPETLQAYLKNYKYGPFWKGMNSVAHAHQVNTPGVYWGGWYDIFGQGTIDSFQAVHNRGGPRARGKCRLVVGPWAHGKLVELQYPANAKSPSGVKSLDAMAFFDYHLRGLPNGIDKEKAVHYYVMGDPTDPKAPGNFWRVTDNWPPDATKRKFYFHTPGHLSTTAPQGEAKRSYSYDPAKPVPTIGGQNMIIDRGPMDQRKIESRDDVLVFSSDILKEPIEVTGRIRSTLFVASNCPDTDFTVKLCDVYPDGRSMIVSDGILRARFRKGFDREVFLRPGEVYPIEIDLWSTSLIFNRGHRIRVAISSSNSPRFDPNPNTGKPLRADSQKRVARNTVYFSKNRPSHITLPILTGK